MSDISDIDLVVTSLAVLFDLPEIESPVNSEQLAMVIRRPLGIGQSAEGLLIVNSSRDQIELQLAPNKIDVRDLSGDIDHAKAKLPEVTSGILSLIDNPELTSFGLNFIVEKPMKNPTAWIGQTFLNQELAREFGSSLASTVVVIMRPGSPKSASVRIENRGDSRISINWNASETANSLPDPDQFAIQLQQQYDELVGFIAKFGG